MARPSIYSDSLAEEICIRLMEGQSLRRICEDEEMPGRTTVLRWIALDTNGFGAKYERARVAQMMGEADELLALADESRLGVKTTTKADGTQETVEGDMVERSRMQIETRKWLLSKMLPKVYGDKLDLTHSGRIVHASEMPDDELLRIAAGSGG